MVHPISSQESPSNHTSPWVTLSPASPIDYDTDCASPDTGIDKSGHHKLREVEATSKATALLEAALNDGSMNASSRLQRSDLDRYRAQGATMRAHALLEETLLKTEIKRKDPRELQQILHELRKNHPSPGVETKKNLDAEEHLEGMATSTRKVNKYDAAMEDCESVAEQKCTLDLAMENEAQSKALSLMRVIHERGDESFNFI